MADRIPKIKGTCSDCRVLGFDDTPGCTARDCHGDCIDCVRMAGPCKCTCITMGFAVCAPTTPVSNCICQDGISTAAGTIITGGGFIGFNAPEGATPTEIAALTSPGDPHAYWSLWAANDTTNLNCPPNETGWDALALNGSAYQVDLAPVALSFDGDGNCISGAITLTAPDVNISGGGEITDAGTNCVQTGGRRAFALLVKDGNGKQIMFCPIPGILPAGQCDHRPCCNWAILSGPDLSEDGTTATISITLTQPTDCECTATGTLTIDDGVNPPTPYALSTTPRHIDHDISPYTAGQVVTITLAQTYGGCGTCVDSSASQTITLT